MESIINPETLVVKKAQNFLEATGLTEKLLASAHHKFITIMQKECGEKLNCSAKGYKKYLESLSVLEQKSVLFYALCELNRATHELSKKYKGDKKIFIPEKEVIKPK